ncbi:S-layer domain protein [Paenibacillus curdlanolyticus YK9]|uniref:S-layer domain protein n=1 Tax=Paenibacillus curdlanolyticus YK9 TaxID=717606 RepID=E0ICZ4_9BACL|nr:S-layer homology domain-containing protein [Paenibacillus curdlanolyticus]EFM09449.1 S-layer domain protein [Paenibacillus curdlanolyticus YK9]
MKKHLAACLAIALLSSGLHLSESTAAGAASAPAGSFSDIADVPKNVQQSIIESARQGLLLGTPTGEFHPHAALTRAELAVVIQRALQLPQAGVKGSFSDVIPGSWAEHAIEAVRAAGIMTGDKEGCFRPASLITREELAVVLERASESALVQSEAAAAEVTDWEAVREWARPYVLTSLSQGVMTAEGGAFHPKGTISRQEAAEMLLQTFFPTARPSQLGKVEENRVWINGVQYQLSDKVKGVLSPSNAEVLKGSTLTFSANGRKLERITSLQLHASGQAAGKDAGEFTGNLTLDGHGSVLEGNLTLDGDYLTVCNLTVSGNFKISSKLENDFFAHQLTVLGRTEVQGGDDNTVVFEDSKLGTVDVDKTGVRVEATGSTTIAQMTVSSDALLFSGSDAKVEKVELADGVTELKIVGSIENLVITGSQSIKLNIASGTIGTISVQSTASVQLTNGGTVNKLEVLDAKAHVEIGQGNGIPSITYGTGVPTSTVTYSVTSGSASSQGSATSNMPPTASNIEDKELTLGDGPLVLMLDSLISDPDGDSLSYEVLSSRVRVARITMNGSQLTLTPLTAGTTTITIQADDGRGGLLTKSFVLTIKPVNHKPTVIQAPSAQTLTVGGSDFTLDVANVFSDSDGDALTFTVSSSDAGTALASVSGTQLTVHGAAAGTATITLTATDTHGAAEDAVFTVTVNAAPSSSNHKPTVIQAPSAQTLTVGGSDFTLDAANVFSDSDGDALTFTAASSDAGTALASVSGTQLTVHGAAAGTATITLTATDTHGAAEDAVFTVTVNAAPSSPNHKPTVIQAPSAQTLTVGGSDFTLDVANVFSDSDGDALTFTASSSDAGTALASVSGTQLTVHGAAAGTANITLTATDTHGAAEDAVFTVTVNAAPSNANHNPDVVASIPLQVLTIGITATRTYDLSNLFSDPEGDVMTFSAVSSSSEGADVSVSGSMLTVTPGTGAASAVVTVTADDGRGGTASYDFNVRSAPLVTNGSVVIRTKRGIKDPIVYDLRALFPNETSFTIYKGNADATLSGPTIFNGTAITVQDTANLTWVVGADGKAAVIQLIEEAQGPLGMYFSEYMDGGNGRSAIELYFNGDGDPSHKAEGYTLEVHRFNKQSNSVVIDTQSVFSTYPNMPYIVINSTFYDFFDLTNAMYYNEEANLYNPTAYNVVALVLKKNGQVVDVIGDPSSHDQLLPAGGTIVRKSGIYSGSSTFSLYGEWNIYPIGSYQFIGNHMP